ncbi:hypothetical protein [Pseudomonas alvandae]|uniref:Uncharacterized protein n=1 Tax=Pseudomonas canavaninivorans TaxID=2842348 RepID=A0ABX8QHB6_PSECO|nr:hypothetical protein [Pseudomonas alvandae]QXI54222.1 hypothetical protein KSS97_04510 [Pseudomonas alvandae]
MDRTFQPIERALKDEFERIGREYPDREIKTAIEDGIVRKVIREILSLPLHAKVPGTADEHSLLESIICLVSSHNRKWLSEIQVAIPYSRLTSKLRPKDAQLKAKVPVRTVPDEVVGSCMLSDMQLRNYFLKWLWMCVPESELETFPHLLSLFNQNEDAAETTDRLEVVMESGAWEVLTKCQQFVYASEKKARPAKRKSVREYSNEDIKGIQAKILASMTQSVSESTWRSDLLNTLPSQDGLFAKLLINAALNRFILENWAFEKRTRSVAEIHSGFLSELEETAPEGLVQMLDEHRIEGKICHRDLAWSMLQHSLSNHRSGLTPTVVEALDAQSDAVLASAALKEYEAEREVNRIFSLDSDTSRAMIWLALAWIYLNGKTLPNDNSTLHATGFRPVSRRAKTTQIGQNMVSLRRVLSSLLLNHHHELPSAERSGLHAKWVIDVRSTVIRTLLDNFKQATLSQWDSALTSGMTDIALRDLLGRCGLPSRPV